MNKIFLILAMVVLQFSFAENTATVNVKVENPTKKAISGEQILFVSTTNSKIYKGISNELGDFEIDLPTGDVYNISIKRIGAVEEYNTLEIPNLEENQRFSKLLLTITISEPTVFTLENVYFESGKHTLLPKSFEALEELKEYLLLKDNTRIEIGGHTDNVGEEESNSVLSLARANAVKLYLIKQGITADRLEVNGYGESQPIATNQTAAGRQINRRTEVRIL